MAMKIDKQFFITMYNTLNKYNNLLCKLDELGVGTEDLAFVMTDIFDALEISENFTWSDEIWDLIYNNPEFKTSADEVYDTISKYQEDETNRPEAFYEKERERQRKIWGFGEKEE